MGLVRNQDARLRPPFQNANGFSMAVYVDAVRPCIPNKKWRWNKSAHLFADTDGELHAFAKSIGLHRSWFQVSKGRYELRHYDLTEGKHRQAIRQGAILLESIRDTVAKWKEIHLASR